jgi:hypothetical protein
MKRLQGFQYLKEPTQPLSNKFNLCLNTLKKDINRAFTIDELILGMGYKNGRADRKAAEVVIYKLKSLGCLVSVTDNLESEPSTQRRLFIEGSPVVSTWLNRLNSEETKEKFLYEFRKYFMWVKAKGLFSSPDVMIENFENAATIKERYKHITFIEDYLISSKLNIGQKKSSYVAIRSFYKHNKAELPRYALKFKENGVTKPLVTQQPITLEEMRQLLAVAKPREQAIFLISLQAGLDRSTFAEYFNLNCWRQITQQLGNNDPELWDLSKAPIQINLVRIKTHVPYYSFISVDALKALQAWLNVRKTLTNKPMREGEPLFISKQRTPLKKESLSYLFNQCAISAGLESKKYGKASEIRYRFHGHELRDIFRTTCTVSGLDHPVSEFFIGHTIDKLGYDKSPTVYPEHYKAQYKKVEPMLNIFSSLGVNAKKLGDMEQKLNDKEKVIDALAQNSTKKDQEFLELKSQVETMQRLLTAIYEGKAKPDKELLLDKPNVPVFEFNSLDEMAKAHKLTKKEMMEAAEDH